MCVLQDGKRTGEFLNKGIGFTGVAVLKDNTGVYVTAADNTVKFIDMVNGVIGTEADAKSSVASLVLSSGANMMFVGTHSTT